MEGKRLNPLLIEADRSRKKMLVEAKGDLVGNPPHEHLVLTQIDRRYLCYQRENSTQTFSRLQFFGG